MIFIDTLLKIKYATMLKKFGICIYPIPYGDKELIKVEDAIRIIKKAGGLSFLAHDNKFQDSLELNK